MPGDDVPGDDVPKRTGDGIRSLAVIGSGGLTGDSPQAAAARPDRRQARYAAGRGPKPPRSYARRLAAARQASMTTTSHPATRRPMIPS